MRMKYGRDQQRDHVLHARAPIIDAPRTDQHSDARMKRRFVFVLGCLLAGLSVSRAARADPAHGSDTTEPAADDGWLDISAFLDEKYGFLPMVMPITEPAVGYGAAFRGCLLEQAAGCDASGTRTTQHHVGRRSGHRERLVGRLDRGHALLARRPRADPRQRRVRRREPRLLRNWQGQRPRQPAVALRAQSIRGLAAGQIPLWRHADLGRAELRLRTHPGVVRRFHEYGTATQLRSHHAHRRAHAARKLRHARQSVHTAARHLPRVWVWLLRQSAGWREYLREREPGRHSVFPAAVQLVPGIARRRGRDLWRRSVLRQTFYPHAWGSGDALSGRRSRKTALELRWRFWRRISLVAFGGVGCAWNHFEKFDNSTTVVAGGPGIRYELARRYGIHMGIDVGFSRDATAFYVQVGNAWLRP